jgi:hypothetical protein
VTTTKDLSFISYISLANIMAGSSTSTFQKFPCEISSSRNILISQISEFFQQNRPNNVWYHWIIKGVVNPMKYFGAEKFIIRYQSGISVEWIT